MRNLEIAFLITVWLMVIDRVVWHYKAIKRWKSRPYWLR